MAHGQVQRYHRVTAAGVRKGVRQGFSARGYIRVLIPVETIARKGCGITRIAVIHCQVQRHHTVTTRGIGKGVFQAVRTGRDIMMFIPVKTVAGKRCRVTRIAMTHRQLQRHQAVTTARTFKHVRQTICTGGDIGVLVPIETVAGEGYGIAIIDISDGQMQGHHTVATGSIGKRVRRGNGWGLRVCCTVPREINT